MTMNEEGGTIGVYKYPQKYMDGSQSARSMMAPDGPAAGVPRSESPSADAPPLSARAHAQNVRQRAPGTMLDIRPQSARLPGYTGHQPGIIAESLLGHSYAYITGYREDLLHTDDDAWLSEYNRSHGADGCLPTPKPNTMSIEAAAAVPRPTTTPAGGREQRFVWENQDKYFSVLNLNRTGRMPGYTGHAPHFRFEGSVGLAYGKAVNTGDHLRPADGSHCQYVHEEPQRMHGGARRGDPIAGYSGFVPFMQESTTGHNYHSALNVCRETRAIEPSVLRKELDAVHSGYTPSMKVALKSAQPHGRERSPYGNAASAVNTLAVKRDALQPRGVIAGYSGFRPGRGVSMAPPDMYRPKLELSKPRMEKHLRGSIFIGDLTQEWNLGKPYWRTNQDYGAFTAQADPNHPHDKIVQQPSTKPFPIKKVSTYGQ